MSTPTVRKSWKLNAVKAAEIRASDVPTTVLAERYGVTAQAIYDVRAGRTWVGQEGRLTEDDVRAIRRRHAAGESSAALAKAFPQTKSGNIYMIVTRRSWKHVA